MIMLNGKDSFWLQLEVCREFQRARCSRSDGECKFAHPPSNVEVQSNGRVTACYDSIKGRCQRECCKYMHPPAHLKDQLLINGRNHLALKNALLQQQQHLQDPHSQQQPSQQQQAAFFQSAVAAAAHQQQQHHLKPTSYDLSMQPHPAAALAAAIAASAMNPFMTPGAFSHSYAQYALAAAAQQQPKSVGQSGKSSPKQVIKAPPTHYSSAQPELAAYYMSPLAAVANMLSPQPGYNFAAGAQAELRAPASDAAAHAHYQSLLAALYPARALPPARGACAPDSDSAPATAPSSGHTEQPQRAQTNATTKTRPADDDNEQPNKRPHLEQVTDCSSLANSSTTTSVSPTESADSKQIAEEQQNNGTCILSPIYNVN